MAPTEPVIERRVLSSGTRFSESPLWDLQRRFFARQGLAAWSADVVPHYVTSNPVIATAYARVVFGYLRDWHGELDDTAPLTIVELGAGSGRFAATFVTKLLALIERSPLRGLRFRYVMTDFTATIVEAWPAHPVLAGLVARGVLDFAVLDTADCRALTLHHAGERLTVGTVINPLVVIANYVFDGIPMDLFQARGGRLDEVLTTLTVDGDVDLDDPTLIERIKLDFTARPIGADYYREPALDRILAEYGARLVDTVLSFPCAAIRCVRDLAELASGRLLLLTGDKGYHLEDDLRDRAPAPLAVHGSFSLLVNFHAIGQAIRHLGGVALTCPHRHTTLDICGFTVGAPAGGLLETALAFDEAVASSSPDDLYTVRRAIAPSDPMTLSALLALIRISGCDGDVLLDYLPRLTALAGELPLAGKLELRRLVRRVWDQHFSIGEARDLAFALAHLLFALEFFAEALELFEASRQSHGANPGTLVYLALCHVHLGQLEPALRWADAAVALAPDFPIAVELQRRLRPGA